MVQGVYVDILLAVNFCIHFLLLSLLAQVSGREQNKRIAVAAAAGALFSLTIFLPPMSAVAEMILKCLSSMLMVLCAFRFKGLRTLLYEWVLLLLITAAFYGLLSMLQRLYSFSRMFVFSNAVYFHIRVPVFIICLAAAYAVVWVANRVLQSAGAADTLYDVCLSVDGTEWEGIGFVDTGNGLSEPFSGAPVIVCGLDTAAKLLSAPLLTAVLGGQNDQCSRVRQIPFSAVSGSGMMPAVKGESITLRQGSTLYCSEHFYLAVSTEKIGGEDWQILLHQKLLQNEVICTKGQGEQDECCKKQKI